LEINNLKDYKSLQTGQLSGQSSEISENSESDQLIPKQAHKSMYFTKAVVAL